MNNFIFSSGVGEILLDPNNMHWYMADSSFFDKKRYTFIQISIKYCKFFM